MHYYFITIILYQNINKVVTIQIIMLEIEDILKSLAKEKPVFYSEKDFQCLLGWQIKETYPDVDVRSEVPIEKNDGKIEHIDLRVRDGKSKIGIELKYITRSFKTTINGDEFNLKNHAANDLRCYDVLKDIQRLESYIENEKIDKGYSIVLTNVESLWSKNESVRETYYDNFRIGNGNIVTGELKWKENINGETNKAADGTKKGRKKPINLQGTYNLNWMEYFNNLSEEKESKKGGLFKYLLVEIKP